jgi:hypothetical protein
MSRPLILFSHRIEQGAAFAEGAPDGVDVEIAGVGLVDAGIGAARAIDRLDPTCVIFAGTCGAHRQSGLPVGGLHLVSQAFISSGDLARAEMRIPTLLPAVITVDPDLNESFASAMLFDEDATAVRCSCTLGVTESDELAEMLAGSGADVENLELFAVLRAAVDRPAAALLGVTNIVGAGGGNDWRVNYGAVMSEIGKALRKGIESGSRIFSPNFMKE